jgi:hypothetical protein
MGNAAIHVVDRGSSISAVVRPGASLTRRRGQATEQACVLAAPWLQLQITGVNYRYFFQQLEPVSVLRPGSWLGFESLRPHRSLTACLRCLTVESDAGLVRLH